MTRTAGWVGFSILAVLGLLGCLAPVDEFSSDGGGGAAGGGSGGGALSGLTTTELKSDPSWKLVGNVPPAAGWNDDANFNDSAWGFAVLQSPQGPESRGASVWDGVTPGAGSRAVFLRKTFTVSGVVESAELNVACNDDMEVWINGTMVVTESDGITSYRTGLDVHTLLAPGTNLIAASCRDVVGPEHSFHAWLVFTAR